MFNPYAHALDGLDLPDPVAAFFAFCREREAVRVRRDQGAPPPWSVDPIFQKGRFLNVFREDDRTSRAIARFVEPVAGDLERLVHAVFFARWCNRQETLDRLTPDLLESPQALENALARIAPWCNATAYPVEPLSLDGRKLSRLRTATHELRTQRGWLAHAVKAAHRDVVRATRAINARFGMQNDFPIFMAVVDIATFRPDLIDPNSHVPTGIGAAPFLDRLQAHLGAASHAETCDRIIGLQPQLWPEARRALQPIDVEYLSCECRKYWSYVNGSKDFTGKNAFHPGRTPRVQVDVVAVPGHPTQTRIHVLAGGPCSGKSTLANALEQRGYRVVPETSRVLIEASDDDPRVDPIAWQTRVLHADHALFDALPADQIVVTDTSFIENLVFAHDAGIEIGPNLDRWLRTRRYATVFFLHPLETYQASAVRTESAAEAARISEQVRQRYVEYGYDVVSIPAAPLAQRLAWIRERLDA